MYAHDITATEAGRLVTFQSLARAPYANGPLIDPSQPLDLRWGNIRLLQRDNEVLRYLADTKDEREFRRMRTTEPRLSTSVRSLNALMMSFGFQVELPEGRSTPARIELKEAAEAALKNIVRLPDVLELSTQAVYEGWIPFQAVWNKFRRKGRTWWGMHKLRDMKQEYFSFTPEEDLVLHAGGLMDAQVFKNDLDQMAWVIFQSGSTSSPYGSPQFAEIWLLWHLKQRFFKYFARGMRDAANGIPKIRETGPPALGSVGEIDGGEGGSVMAQMTAEVVGVLKRLERDGVLILRAGLDLELLKNESFGENWLRGLEHVNDEMQTAIEGQLLTSGEGKQGGSRAMGDTHQATKMAYAQRLARKLEPIIDRQVLKRVLEVNLGEVDPEDIPGFRFNIHSRVELDKLKAIVDMGGRVAAEPVADQWNVTLAAEDAEPGTVLERRALPALRPAGSPAGNPPPGQKEPPKAEDDPTPGAPGEPSRGRTAARTADSLQVAADRQDTSFEALAGAAEERASPLFQAYVARMRDAVLKATDGDAYEHQLLEASTAGPDDPLA